MDLEEKIIRISEGGDIGEDSDQERDGDDGGYVKQPDGAFVATDMLPRGGGVGNSKQIKKSIHTGVKGVLRDHDDALCATRVLRGKETKKLNELVANLSLNAHAKVEEQEELDDDEEAIRRYREQRLKEIQRINTEPPKYGTVQEINGKAFVSIVDHAHDLTTVIIHLYQNHVPSCNRLNKILFDLASKFQYIRFARIVSTEAQADYDEIALPTLLVYHNGELVTSIIRLTDEIGELFSLEDVQNLFAKWKIMPEFEEEGSELE